MTKRFVLLASILGVLVMVGPASAQVILDFGPGLTGTSGSCTLTSTDAKCTGVGVGVLGVSNDGADSGTYGVDSGLMSFDLNTSTPSSDFVTISGSVDCLANSTLTTVGNPCFGHSAGDVVLASETLLSESGTGLSASIILGPPGAVSWVGPDEKSQDLLRLLGLSTSLCSGSPGMCIGWNFSPPAFADIVQQASGAYQVTSYDISNAAVPEPTSVLLLGTILFGVTGLIRRHARKA